MYKPIVKPFKSTKTPWQIYQAMQATSELSFFLDSDSSLNSKQMFSYLGASPFLTLRVKDGIGYLRGEENKQFPVSDLFKVLRRLFSKYRAKPNSKHPFFLGGAVGFWGYEMVELFENVRFRKKKTTGFEDLFLGFYRNLIAYDHSTQKYYLIAHQKKSDKRKVEKELKKLKAFFDQAEDAQRFKLGLAPRKAKTAFHFKSFKPDVSKLRFEKNVQKTKKYIEAGDIYQANISQRFSFRFEGSPTKLYDRLRKINPSPFSSFLDFGDLKVISCSPERLVRKRGFECETRPIAGTRPRKVRKKSARQIAKELTQNEKERAEHLMLVDLERNDLGRVCDYQSVRVEEFMSIEKYSHVMHLVSKVVGKLQKGKDAFDLIQAMFPGGTITGCPKVRCMEIIDELEPSKRGIYTGSIGFLDFNGDLDLNIVIRTIVLYKNRGHFQVGAGIVYDSEPSREYQETLHKGEALMEALVEASL